MRGEGRGTIPARAIPEDPREPSRQGSHRRRWGTPEALHPVLQSEGGGAGSEPPGAGAEGAGGEAGQPFGPEGAGAVGGRAEGIGTVWTIPEDHEGRQAEDRLEGGSGGGAL